VRRSTLRAFRHRWVFALSTNRTEDGRRERQITIDSKPWTVSERVFQLDRRSAPSLVFDSGDIMRRVRDYPENWYQLDDASLVALCVRRVLQLPREPEA